MARLVAVAVCVAALVVSGPAAWSSGTASDRSQLYAPTTLPDGWFVLQARPPQPVPRDLVGSWTYYEGDDSALAVGEVGVDQGFARLDGRPRSIGDIEPGGEGTLVRNGDWVWVSWPRVDLEDLVGLVAARGVSDREAIAAAKAASFSGERSPRIARRGLPARLTKRVSASLGPDIGPAGAESITLVDSTGRAHIELVTYRAGRAVRAFHRFWTDQVARRRYARRAHHAVFHDDGNRVVVGSGATDTKVLKQLVESTAPADDEVWQAFRRRVTELPLRAITSRYERQPGTVLLDGHTDTTRWWVSFSPTPVPSTSDRVIDADQDSGGGGSANAPDELPPGIREVNVSSTVGAGTLVMGVTPVATAMLRFEPSPGVSIEITPSDVMPDPTRRYFAGLLPEFVGGVRVVALDAHGVEIARREQYGCTSCP